MLSMSHTTYYIAPSRASGARFESLLCNLHYSSTRCDKLCPRPRHTTNIIAHVMNECNNRNSSMMTTNRKEEKVFNCMRFSPSLCVLIHFYNNKEMRGNCTHQFCSGIFLWAALLWRAYKSAGHSAAARSGRCRPKCQCWAFADRNFQWSQRHSNP